MVPKQVLVSAWVPRVHTRAWPRPRRQDAQSLRVDGRRRRACRDQTSSRRTHAWIPEKHAEKCAFFLENTCLQWRLDDLVDRTRQTDENKISFYEILNKLQNRYSTIVTINYNNNCQHCVLAAGETVHSPSPVCKRNDLTERFTNCSWNINLK